MTIPSLDKLKEMCEQHDWFYSFSDDHKVWERGNEEIKAIREMMILCQESGMGREAKQIYENWKPEGVNFG
jgi:hypothetical protein